MRACSGAPSCAVLLLILSGGGGGGGYIGTCWWAAAQSVAGCGPVTAHPSPFVHSFHGASQSPPRSHEDQAVENKLWVSVRKGRWPRTGGPFAGRVGVTWEGSPCNGCLWASVVSAAASSTS